ncbi:rare lipoprotein A [Modicisalibacter muralis]|uniref:Endolytic peptidoglycan transglycosylase RlpA n=1 Tax=Modicisalibacter muralis TaxID=119000 RepID=A0A1G9MFW7_9GAMM|nr:septal ring lytic transglycosylase RlpA family protein [Halomonas muralis]SDL72565.1 rare lipoprotein A [Halomonas muralis]
MIREMSPQRWAMAILTITTVGLLAGCAGTPTASSPSSAALSSFDQRGQASYYSDAYQGEQTASGERYDRNAMTAAHPSLPFGTRVRVTNLDNGCDVSVRINDRGPYTSGRIIDLSYQAAEQLGMIRSGTAPVAVEVMN